MATHEFTLILNQDPEPLTDALYEAGCDDALLGRTDGVFYADFDRDAATFTEALLSAIRDVEQVDGLRVLHVEPDDLVTAAEIAERLGRTHESIRLLASGRRGDGSFPRPISHARARSRLWRWSDVERWAGAERPDTTAVAATNAALELRSLSDALEPTARDQVRALAG